MRAIHPGTGAHKYDMAFGKVWQEVVSERAGSKKLAPSQLASSGRMSSGVAESRRDEGDDDISVDPRRQGEAPAKRASASSRQGYRDMAATGERA